MEEKGLQEDPRYSQLLALRARQGNNMDPNQRPPSTMQVSLTTILLFNYLNNELSVEYIGFKIVLFLSIYLFVFE